jgi:hypothetical protein
MRSFYVLDPRFSCRLLDFSFCCKKHGNLYLSPVFFDTLNFFFLVLTAASSFFTQDCSRPPYGKKEMSAFLVVSFDLMNPEFSANL